MVGLWKTTCFTLARDLNGYRRTFLEFVAVTENAEGDVNVQLLVEFVSPSVTKILVKSVRIKSDVVSFNMFPANDEYIFHD